MRISKMAIQKVICENLYDVLGVPLDASNEELKRKHRENLLRCSPDKVGYRLTEDELEEVTRHHLKLQEAWKVLSDPKQRQQYDARLKAKALENNAAAMNEVTVTEMEFDPDENCYYYPCRCGGEFEVLRSCVPVDVHCPTCSTTLRAVHEKT